MVLVAIGAAACSDPAPTAISELQLSVVGGPVDEHGVVGVNEARLEVLDPHGRTVRFSDSLVADPAGKVTELTIGPGAVPLAVFLPQGASYTFLARGLGAGGELVAFGQESRVAAAGGNNAVIVEMAGLIGEARLERRTPVHALLPGQTLDLLLTVTAAGSDELVLAPSDFRVSYEAANATTLSHSGRGVRLRAGERHGGDLVVRADVSGLVPADPHPEQDTVSAEVRIPFTTDAGVDLTPPEVSTLAFDPVQQVLTGVADDDLGVVTLEVYDGPVLLASSDPDTVAAKGVSEVRFPGGGTAFLTFLQLPAGTYELIVYATDFSRNQGSASYQVTVP